jgi:hypothetical protein
MEQNLSKLNLIEYQQKQENEKLLKEKLHLEEKLQESFKSLQDYKSYMSILQQQTREEQMKKAK